MGELPEEYDDAWLDYLPQEAKLEWLRQGAAGANPPPAFSGALPALSDPELAGYVGLASNSSRRKSLQGQLEQGQALQSQGQGQYTSILGAALGGLGSLVNTGMGLHQQRKAQRGLDDLAASETATRSRFARGAQTWDPSQAANLGLLSGDPVLGAYGESQQKQLQNSDTRGLRGIGLEQARERLELLKQESARKAATGEKKFDLEEWRARQQAAMGWKGLGLREQEAAQQQAGNQYKVESGLRDEYYKQPAVREFPGIQGAYSQVQKAASDPNGVNDLTLIFGLMKMLDPGVSVMEGDIRNVSQTQNIPDQIYSTYLKAKNGERFAPETRQQILRTAGQVYESKRQIIDGMKSQYRSLASQTGATPERVVLPDIDLTSPPTATRTAPQASEQDRAAMQWLQANPNDPRAPAIRRRLQEKGIAP